MVFLGRLEGSLPTLLASCADSGIVAGTLRPPEGLSWGVLPEDDDVVERGCAVRVGVGPDV